MSQQRVKEEATQGRIIDEEMAGLIRELCAARLNLRMGLSRQESAHGAEQTRLRPRQSRLDSCLGIHLWTRPLP